MIPEELQTAYELFKDAEKHLCSVRDRIYFEGRKVTDRFGNSGVIQHGSVYPDCVVVSGKTIAFKDIEKVDDN